MATYTKSWLGEQDAWPGFQDWNELQEAEEDHREALDFEHHVLTSPRQRLMGEYPGDHDAREIPRGVCVVRPVTSGSAVGLQGALLRRPVVGLRRIATGEYVVATKGLTSAARAHVTAKTTGGSYPRRVHAERFLVDAVEQGNWLEPGDTGEGFYLRLYEWSGSAWAAADFEVSVAIFEE